MYVSYDISTTCCTAVPGTAAALLHMLKFYYFFYISYGSFGTTSQLQHQSKNIFHFSFGKHTKKHLY